MAMTPEERMEALLRGTPDDPKLAEKIKKPRVRQRKKGPASPERKEQLLKASAKTRLNYTPDSTIPRCHLCRRVAVRGLKVCWHHGGATVAEQRKLEKGILRDPSNRIRSNIRRLIHNGELPPELVATPVFKAVLLEERALVKKRPFTSDIVTRLAILRTVLYKLTFGWTQLEIDPNNRDAWTTAVKLAADHGIAI